MASRLVFMHIPKCGGTSFHKVLQARFNPAVCCPERLRFLDRMDEHQIRRYEFYSGHYYFDQLARIPEPKCIVTMLREPRARLLSLYYFFRSHTWEHVAHCERLGIDSPRFAKVLDLLTCLSSSVALPQLYMNNAMTKHLIGLQHVGPTGELLVHPDEAFTLAVRHLTAMSAVGVLEYFSTTRHALMSAIGFDLPEALPRENTFAANVAQGDTDGIEKHDRFDDQTEAAIARSIEIDKRVYNWALNHLEISCREHIPS